MSQERDKFEAWATPRFPGLDLSWDTEAREYFTAEAHMAYHAFLASRRAALEEAAQVAESDQFYGSALQHDIAYAIRKLGEDAWMI